MNGRRAPPNPMHHKNRPTVKLRDTFEDVGFHAREAVLAVEEGVVWRGTDAARELAERTAGGPLGQAAVRIRFVVDRKLAWPLADALRDRGEFARTRIATAAVAVALAAGSGGAMLASSGGEAAPPASIAQVSATGEVEAGITLEGVNPTFASSQGGSDAQSVRAQPAPKAGPERSAWEFAQAFVLYEVGQADDVAEQFQRLATPALAASLKLSPPRLPSNVKVPEARVLNVVLGKPHGDTVEASVSLLRLQAVSELRFTLTHSKPGWRVSEVRG
jgi:hypothetical protein